MNMSRGTNAQEYYAVFASVLRRKVSLMRVFKATFYLNVILQSLCRINAVWISGWEPAGHHKLNHRHLVFACSLLN
jgi:hypothetical protein